MSVRRRSWARRDQAPTRFTPVLARLCQSTAALGAALVDRQGETVDYAGYVPPFDLKVAAAEWRLVLAQLARSSCTLAWPDTHELVVRAARLSFIAVPLGEGYALVVQLCRHAGGISRRALGEAERALCREAALETPRPPPPERWELVEVRTASGNVRRPQAIWHGGQWHQLEILGRYRARELGRREVGYRARLGTRVDISLVREPLGRWYALDLPDP
jgi:hypothetical protein